MAKKTVLSGMRPTGALHLGNYVGALRNWIKLQDIHRCFYTIVPWHALSSEYQNPKVIKEYTFEVALDWLASGLDPENRFCSFNPKLRSMPNFIFFYQ
jgi:Tryptophanyl-tRNA synthetase